MLLNRIFIAMFVLGISFAFGKLIFFQDLEILNRLVQDLFDSSKTGFELSLYLTGALCLWMGLLAIGEKGGAIHYLTKMVSPLFTRLFPDVPKDHPAMGAMMMNFSANMLGLDNAATPMGLKAMSNLQDLNPDKKTASNAQIMFLVLNTSGLTLIPVSILSYRTIAGSTDPTSVFVPILCATFFSSLVGLIYVSIRQKINLLNPVVLAYLGGLSLLVIGIVVLAQQNPESIKTVSPIVGNGIILLIILTFFGLAVRKKVNAYDVFIEGAKDGFKVAIKIVPYLVSILCAIAVFRASGLLNDIMTLIRSTMLLMGFHAVEFLDALPVGLMKPFSGSGSRGLMLELFANKNFGVDSFAGKVASTMQGSTETTFYVLSVYFGSVGVSKTRYAAGAGLLADFAGIVGAIYLSYLFYSV